MRLIITLLFILSACVNLDKNGPKATTVNGFNIESKRCLALQDQKEFVWGEWPEEKWWEIFGDCHLNQLIETALKENFSLQSTEARIRKVKAEADIVRARLFPQLNALFSFFVSYLGKEVRDAFPNLGSDSQFYTGALTFSYEFDFWGKNRKLFAAALGEVKVEEAIYQQSKINLAAQIAVEYFNLQATLERIRLVNELVSARQKQLELVVIRDKYQIDSGIDINQKRSEVVILEKSLAVMEEELALQESLLATLMGHNPTERIALCPSWKTDFQPFNLPKDIGSDFLVRRPDVAAQMARVVKSAKLVDVAVTEFFPNISLVGFAGFLSPDINQWFTSGGFSAGVLPMITIPIFQGGRIKANLREKVASHEMIVHEYNNTLLQAANEVVSGISRLMGVNKQLTLQNTEVGLVKGVYDLVEIKYKQGMESLLGELGAKEKLLWVSLSRVDLERTKYESVILLIKALGGGFGSNE